MNDDENVDTMTLCIGIGLVLLVVANSLYRTWLGS